MLSILWNVFTYKGVLLFHLTILLHTFLCMHIFFRFTFATIPFSCFRKRCDVCLGNKVATVASNQIGYRNIDDGSKLIEWFDEYDCSNRIKVKMKTKIILVDSHNGAFYCYCDKRASATRTCCILDGSPPSKPHANIFHVIESHDCVVCAVHPICLLVLLLVHMHSSSTSI